VLYGFWEGCVIPDEPFKRSNSYGVLFCRFVEYAIAFALLFVLAYPAAEAWKEVSLPYDVGRFVDIAFPKCLDEAGNIDLSRASLNTGGFGALQAANGFR
jgi:hypothetical protein